MLPEWSGRMEWGHDPPSGGGCHSGVAFLLTLHFPSPLLSVTHTVMLTQRHTGGIQV